MKEHPLKTQAIDFMVREYGFSREDAEKEWNKDSVAKGVVLSLYDIHMKGNQRCK